MFYSPVLKIAYDGIFRLRDIEAKDSLLSTFEKELDGNCMLLDRGRTQSHEVRHSEDTPLKKKWNITLCNFRGLCKQLALCLHQAV